MNFKNIIIIFLIIIIQNVIYPEILHALPGRELIYNMDARPTIKSTSIIPESFISSTRPIIADTYYLTSAQKAKLKLLAGKTVYRDGVAITFNRNGYPQFLSKFTAKLRSSQYWLGHGKHFAVANKQLVDAMITNPEIKNLFSPEQLKKLDNLRKAGNLTEQSLANLTPDGYTWHHSEKKGILELVNQKEHSPGKGGVFHSGGAVRWATRPTWETYKLIALRWSYFAFTDATLSLGGMYLSDNLDSYHTMKMFSGVASSWSSAALTESLLIKFIPAAIGGPAAISASVVYILVRFSVDKCWEYYLQEQILRQELACKAAEQKARWQIFNHRIQLNDKLIDKL